MATLAILAGIGVFCWLLYNAAIYTLPFLVGAFVGLHAEQAEAGPLGGIVLGIGAGVLVLVAGRAAFAQARGPVLRVVIALIFAAPAALAGISCTSATFCMAVGGISATMSGQVAAEDWTGAWHRLTIGKPGGADCRRWQAVALRQVFARRRCQLLSPQ